MDKKWQFQNLEVNSGTLLPSVIVKLADLFYEKKYSLLLFNTQQNTEI